MWIVNNNSVHMAEGDYGIALHIRVHGGNISPVDSFKFAVKKSFNGETIFEKTLTYDGNDIQLILTEAESELLPIGNYVFTLDWYLNNVFMCNLVPAGILVVDDKG